MSPHPSRAALALAILGVTAAGCDSTPVPDDGPTQTSSELPTGASADPAAATPSGALELTGWQQTHPGAISAAVHAIEVDEGGHVLLDVEVVTSSNDIQLARFGTFLLDDLDNRYELVPPPDNPEIAIPPDSRMRARLAFEGPISDDATHVTFAINAVGDRIVDAEDDTNPFSSGPKLAFRDLPLPGIGLQDEADRGESTALVADQSIDLDVTQTHPTGVVVTVTRIFTDTRSVHVDIEVDNPTDREVRILSSNPHLYDAPGQTSRVGGYEWAEVDDTQVAWLDIPAGGEASATLAFRGAVDADATSLELTLNGGADDDSDTTLPGFTFSDLPIPGRDSGTSTTSPSPSSSPSPSD